VELSYDVVYAVVVAVIQELS